MADEKSEDVGKGMKKIVPDTSITIDGKLTDLIESGEIRHAHILVPEAVVDELENQANRGREIGDTGLEELKELQEKADKYDIKIRFVGERPTQEDIDLAKSGRIDAIIRDIAEAEGAALYTADYVQYQVAQSKGIPCRFFEHEDEVKFRLRNYFDEGTMSVHLKQDMVPKAKKGDPGDLEYVDIGDTPIGKDEIDDIANECFEKAKMSEEGLVELSMDGATVLQIGNLRIAITRPPFSKKIEITAVRPVARLSLDDYDMSEKLKERLTEEAEGILVAGSPGHGKSTFVQALGEFYSDRGKVVKTMEHPRDLQTGPEITQYSALEEDMANTGDVLLLVRPDYTVFDEVRKTDDFEVFADMRLAGVGMIGVVHASEAVDAVQRLIGRVEAGVIPQVVDTVVFIENAEIAKVYKLSLTVKVPKGMTEADLARPVIQIMDFDSGEPEYEIYTYGEETVVIPVEEAGDSGGSKMRQLAEEQLRHIMKQYVKDPEIKFESDNQVTLYVEDEDIPRIIGKQGQNIDRIEKEVGLDINVEPRNKTLKDSVDFNIEEIGNSVAIEVGSEYSGSEADIYDGEKHLLTATIGKEGQIRVTKSSDIADKILGAYMAERLSVHV